jgi:hypothetical protein
MKKIILLIALGVYGLQAMAQQVTFKNFVSMDIPKGAVQITKQQAISHASSKYNDTLVTHLYKYGRYDYVYKVNDIVIIINVANRNGNMGESYMEFKKGMDAMAYGVPNFTSSIKRINNIDTVYTTNTKYGKAEYYHFYYFHGKSDNTRGISGILEFDPADADEAKIVLDGLLNSIKFIE